MSGGRRVRPGSARPLRDKDGRPPRMRELTVVWHRAGPNRRAPQSDAGRRAGAGGAQVQTAGDGGRGSGRPGTRCGHRRGAGGCAGGREWNPGERRLGREAWLCGIPRATGQSVRMMTRLLNMDAGDDGDLPRSRSLRGQQTDLIAGGAWQRREQRIHLSQMVPETIQAYCPDHLHSNSSVRVRALARVCLVVTWSKCH